MVEECLSRSSLAKIINWDDEKHCDPRWLIISILKYIDELESKLDVYLFKI
jgi:hypothetical protein